MTERLARGSLSLAVHRQGSGALPLYMQHGLCGSAEQVRGLGLDAGWLAVSTLECRGHGLSDLGPEEALGLPTFEGDLAALLHGDAPDGPVVGGISMGAAMALRLAVRSPGVPRALVLVRPAWGTARRPAGLEGYRALGALLDARPPAEAWDAFRQGPVARDLAKRAPANLASLRAICLDGDPARAGPLLRRVAASGPEVTRAEVGRVAVPALVVGHGDDIAHPLSLARDLARLLPGGRLAVVASKAADPVRHQAETRAAILSFLEELPP